MPTDLKRTDLSVRTERAVLVGVINSSSAVQEPVFLDELGSLARTAGAKVVGSVVQKRREIDPAYYIGRGKAEELALAVDDLDADVVIFDNDLSPGQIRDLESIVGIKIVDRSELILDIFSTRARTRQARLQVELAQLEYTSPRLRGMWSHLERVAGARGAAGAGAVGGIGTRGPGERQIEIDRRLVGRRIADLKAELETIDRRRQREVNARGESFACCLVGYTNAGKSTLMNALTGADSLVEDKLFATLDTKTRRWEVRPRNFVLVSDTVGFVRDLPHHLVASFKATLEEVVNSDLLLHVVDASHPQTLEQIAAVESVLKDLGGGETDSILICNKIDKGPDPAILHIIKHKYPETIEISAATGAGVDDLSAVIASRAAANHVRLEVAADCGNGRLISFLDRHAEVHTRRYEGSEVTMEVSLHARLAARLAGLGALAISQPVGT